MKPDVDAYQLCNEMRAQVDVPIASSYSLDGVSPYVVYYIAILITMSS